MKKLNSYILEKLKLNKDSKTEDKESFIEEIIKLCDIRIVFDKEADRERGIKTITEWCNKGDYSDIEKIANISDIKKNGLLDIFTFANEFKDESERVNKIIDKVILQSLGKEVMLGSWLAPKLYYTDDILLWHYYSNQKPHRGNIDKVFIKK